MPQQHFQFQCTESRKWRRLLGELNLHKLRCRSSCCQKLALLFSHIFSILSVFQLKCKIVKVIFSDESGPNLNLVIPTQYMLVEVMSNQDSILDFPNGPHILSISHLKCHSWISVYFFICKLIGIRHHNMTIFKLIGWWHHNMTILKFKNIHWNPRLIF